MKTRKTVPMAAVALAVAVPLLLSGCSNTRRIRSRILDETRTLLVDLPDGYRESENGYPVLFHLDAFQTSTYGPSMREVGENIAALEGEGIPSVIVVGVMNTDRPRDMVPAGPRADDSAGPRRFLRFIIEELIPYVDREYRTNGIRILYGRSDSGLFAVYALLTEPGAFSAVIASSPTLGLYPQFIDSRIRELFAGGQPVKGALYIVYGDNDHDSVTEHVPILAARLASSAPDDFRWKIDVVPGGGHIPRRGLYDGLLFTFAQPEKVSSSGEDVGNLASHGCRSPLLELPENKQRRAIK